jgi:hypothetical protein
MVNKSFPLGVKGCRALRSDRREQPAEQISRDGDLGHLKGDVTAVAHDLRANLDQLFLQARQRPILDRLRRRQRAQKAS